MTLARLLLALTVGIGAAQAAPPPETSDLGKEQRWRSQIADALVDGEAVELKVGDLGFLGIYTEPQGAQALGRSAILVHGLGVHPDWPQVVQPLRVGLAGRGWATLSIQMPVLGNEHQAGAYGPLLDEVGPRMDAAIAYLKSKGAGPIALVAHSLGATMSASWLAERPNAPIAAYVAIGMPGGGTDPRLDTLAKMGRIRCPMLDLYGQHDLEPVVETAQARVRSALEGGNAGYNQIQVPGADHFFEGEEAALLDSVAGWLDAAVPTQGQSPGQTQAQGAAPQ